MLYYDSSCPESFIHGGFLLVKFPSSSENLRHRPSVKGPKEKWWSGPLGEALLCTFSGTFNQETSQESSELFRIIGPKALSSFIFVSL